MKKLFILVAFLALLFSSCQHPTPPQIPLVEPPASTENPNVVLIQQLTVQWSTNGPDNAGTMAIVVNDDKGENLYAVGMKREGDHPVYVWKSEDSGESWRYAGLITAPDINFKDKDQIYHDFEENAIVSLFACKSDPNNENIILKAVGFGFDETIDDVQWEFRLSFDGGNSWFTLNLPPGWQVKGNVILTDKHHFDLISQGNTLKIFLAAKEVWQTEISLSR